MRTFVISLSRSVERRKLIQQQLDSIQLPFEFFNAVDGRAMTEQFMEENTDIDLVRREPEFLSRGAIGCALSHYSIYKKMVDENIDMALVLEDDVQVSKSLKRILAQVEQVITTDDVVMLYFQSHHHTTFANRHAVSLPDGYNLHYMVEHGWVGAAGAYVLTRPVAEKLVALLHPIHTVADDWTMFKREKAFKYFRCVLPFAAHPAGLKSEIDYLSSNSLVGRVSDVINRYNIFPFKQLLTLKRKSTLKKMQNYVMVDDDPLAA